MTDIALADAPLARDLVPSDRKLLPAAYEVLEEGAKLIQHAGAFVSQDVRKDEGACMALAYIAALHGTDLIATASKAYLVNGRLAFEAQYVSALIRQHIDEPFDIFYQGTGSQRSCRIVGKVGGKPLEYCSPILGQISPRKSPLWVTDPDQQLSYYSQRAWSRRHKPDVLLGIYAVDELQSVVVKDITPPPADPYRDEPAAEDAVDAEFEPSGGFTTDTDARTESPADQQPKADDPLAWFEEVKQDIADCADEPALFALFEQTEANRRALFGADKATSRDLDDLFTERQRELTSTSGSSRA